MGRWEVSARREVDVMEKLRGGTGKNSRYLG